MFVVATNFLINVESFVTIMIVTATPWMVIVGIDFLRRKGRYSPVELHTFAMPGERGRYWYSHGISPVAFASWGVGVVLGLLFSTTSLFTGALESSVQGVDLSWLMAALGGGIVYLALVTVLGSRKGSSAGRMAAAELQERSAT